MRTPLAWLFILSFLNSPVAAQEALSAGVTAPGAITPGEVLTLEKCIDIALRHQPGILAAESTVEADRSRVGQARAGYYPQIEATGYYRSYDQPIQLSSATAGPVSGKEPPFSEYIGAARLRQNLFDFGKTGSQVAIQKFNLAASRSDLQTVTNTVVFNVKQAYYGLSQAERRRKVAEQTVRKFELQLAQAEGFFKAGVRSKFDVTKARVDLSNAHLALIREENACRLAVVSLNNAMGVPDAPPYSIEDVLTYKRYDIPFEEALDRAYRSRPDLLATAARREAAQESIGLARKDYLPTLAGSATYSYQGSRFPLDNGWSVDATLTFPLFSGFSTSHRVKEARANLTNLHAQEESLKQTILFEVKQAYLNLQEAEERIAVAELTVRQARENLEIANGRYAAGVGNPIEVTDAEVAYASAQTDYIQALFDYKSAQASIEKAMGTR